MAGMVVLVYSALGAMALVTALLAHLRWPQADLAPAQMSVAAAGCAGAIIFYFAEVPRAELTMLGVIVVAAYAALRTMWRHQAGRRS